MKRVIVILLVALLLVGCAKTEQTKEINGNNFDDSATITLSDYGITYSGDGISVVGNTVMIFKGGSYSMTGLLSDGSVLVDTQEAVFLTLNGAEITSSKSSAIVFLKSSRAVIEIADGTENRLSDKEGKEGKVNKNDDEGDKNAVIYSNSDIEFCGGGKLFITGNNRGGIHSDSSIDIHSGDLNVSAKNKGVFAQNKITVNGGEISIGRSKEGIESKDVIVINDGRINISAKDDAINAGSNLIVNGGYIYADSKGDGFDSNGDITINGGEIYIFSGNKKNSALDISDGDKIGKFTINGGTVIAAGGDMKIEVENESKQNYAWIYTSHENNVIVQSESGEKVADFSFPKICDLLFISNEKINAGEEYIVIQ